MQKRTENLNERLLKVPGVLEDFLFHKPDLAIIFNSLPVSHKNEWIRAIHKIKSEQAMTNLLFKLEQKYTQDSQSSGDK